MSEKINVSQEDLDRFNKWVAALRSGEYKQAFCRMREGDYYCVAGVFREVAVPEEGRSGCWYGLVSEERPRFMEARTLGVDGLSVLGRVMFMNDYQRKSFTEIADYLDSEVRPHFQLVEQA